MIPKLHYQMVDAMRPYSRAPRCILCDDLRWPCWPGTENLLGGTDSRFHICLAYVCGNIPTKYGLIWYNTSNLGSWNSQKQYQNVPKSFLHGKKTSNKCPIALAIQQKMAGKPLASCQSTAARQPSVTKPCYLPGIAFFPWPN